MSNQVSEADLVESNNGRLQADLERIYNRLTDVRDRSRAILTIVSLRSPESAATGGDEKPERSLPDLFAQAKASCQGINCVIDEIENILSDVEL